jgi:5-methylcytosine-specific restriction endonuclease McrA
MSMKYTRELLAEAVVASTSVAGVMRYLGLVWAGGTHAHISRRIKHFGLDTSHFTGSVHNKGQPAQNRLHWSEILVRRPTSARVKPHQLRRALVEYGVPYRCAACGLRDVWNSRPLVLHVDHIDGNRYDCRPENLRFLCPNCHSQTATWAGANRRNRIYSDAARVTGDRVMKRRVILLA